MSSKRTPGPFTFCTKHPHSFYKSCGCPIPGMRKLKVEPEITVDEESPNASLDV